MLQKLGTCHAPCHVLDMSCLTFYFEVCSPGISCRMEMYCRELTKRFEDVWIVSGPLTLPQTDDDGKKRVTYQVSTCVFMH